MNESFVDVVPTWAFFVAVNALVLASAAIGHRIGAASRRRTQGAPEAPIGSVIGAVLGLLAFILAFVFGMAGNRLDRRKGLLLDEVNAIGTAALRTELLPEPQGSQCRDLLRRYVDARVVAVQEPARLADAIAESERIQGELWARARELARAGMDSPIGALFVEALNDLFDLHTSRVTVVLQSRIQTPIWLVLGGLTILAMAGVGYHFGVAGRSSRAVQLILALSFSLVVTLIADLDRGSGSSIKVNQQPLLQLQKQLSAPPEKPR